MSASMDPAALAALLAEATHLKNVLNIYFTTIYGIAIYDWLVSLTQEYDYIWKAKWTPAKGLYIVTRYWGLGGLTLMYTASQTLWEYDPCKKAVSWICALQMIHIASAQGILALRVHAVFEKNKWLLYALCAFILAEIITCFAVVFWTAIPSVFLDVKDNCLPNTKGKAGYLYWILPLCYDTIATILLVGRCFYLRSTHSATLVRTLINQGVFSYTIVSAVNWINLLCEIIPAAKLWATINGPTSLAATSILACRLVLLLKQHTGGGFTSPSKSLTLGAGAFGSNNSHSVSGVALRTLPKKEYDVDLSAPAKAVSEDKSTYV